MRLFPCLDYEDEKVVSVLGVSGFATLLEIRWLGFPSVYDIYCNDLVYVLYLVNLMILDTHVCCSGVLVEELALQATANTLVTTTTTIYRTRISPI